MWWHFFVILMQVKKQKKCAAKATHEKHIALLSPNKIYHLVKSTDTQKQSICIFTDKNTHALPRCIFDFVWQVHFSTEGGKLQEKRFFGGSVSAFLSSAL